MGPWGTGPMSGRGAGFCAGHGTPGYASPLSGRGIGLGFGRGRGARSRGFGGGRGWRNIFFATGLPVWMRFGRTGAPYRESDPEFEKQVLKSQADTLQAELDDIKKRLAKIDSEERKE
jgi:ribosomal protein L15